MNTPVRLSVLALSLSLAAAGRAASGDAALRAGHPEAAAKLYEKAAAEGDAEAAHKLARLYSDKSGLPEDRQKALTLYKRAYELGDVKSAWEIGRLYHEGRGNVSRDPAAAREWLEKGAAVGHHYAMYELAELHADGLVTPADDVTGLMWLEAVTAFAQTVKPRNEGHDYVLRDPKKVRARLESRMKAPDIAQAKQRAQAWVAQYNANPPPAARPKSR